MARTPAEVNDVGLVRRQFYIEEAHEKALKRRAQELGVSEAEIVRKALMSFLREGGGIDRPRPGRQVALARLLENARRISAAHLFPADYRFDREELYAQRE